MKILTPCFDPLERREIVDSWGVATGIGVKLKKKIRVISKKQFLVNNFPEKIVITRAPDHPQA